MLAAVRKLREGAESTFLPITSKDREDSKDRENVHEPVRVVVSYPLSEEWSPPGPWTKCEKSALALVILAGLALAVFVAFYVASINTTRNEISTEVYNPTISNEQVDPRQFHQQVIEEISLIYSRKLNNKNTTEALKFLNEENNTLTQNGIKSFLLDLETPITFIGEDLDIVQQHLQKFINESIFCFDKMQTEQFFVEERDRQVDFQSYCPPVFAKKYGKVVKLLKRPLKRFLEGNVLHFHGSAIKLSHVISQLNKTTHLFENVTLINIVASTIYIDTNWKRNCDLSIFADHWEIRQPVVIDLSGLDAVDSGLTVEDGKQGANGQYGGFFLGVGNMNKTKITVISNGGAAGNGHRGQPGRNGKWASKPPKETQHPHCFYIRPTEDQIPYYEIYSNETCGTFGGPGGKAGWPGIEGKAIFVGGFGDSTFIGRRGNSATPGEKGTDGTNALGNCFYLAHNTTKGVATHFVQPKETFVAITTGTCLPHSPTLNLPHNLLEWPSEKVADSLEKMDPKNESVFQMATKQFLNLARTRICDENDLSLLPLLQFYESTDFANSFTSPLSLIDEFKEMVANCTSEDVYHSFLSKVSRSSRKDEFDKVALDHLKKVIDTKLLSLRIYNDDYFVVNISEYIDTTLTNIQKMDTIFLVDENERNTIVEKLNEIIQGKADIGQLYTGSKTAIMATKFFDFLPTLAKVVLVHVNNKPLVYAYSELNQEKEMLFYGNDSFDITKNILDINFFEDKSLDSIKAIVNGVLNNFRLSLAEDDHIGYYVEDLRNKYGDLLVLIERSEQFLKISDIMLPSQDPKELRMNSPNLTDLKEMAINSFLRLQYQKVLQAYRFWVYPDETEIPELPMNASKADIVNGLEKMKISVSSPSGIRDRDSREIEADFTETSAIKPFYRWTFAEYGSLIRKLLNGDLVYLRSSLTHSFHYPQKQAIKFKTAEFRFSNNIPKEVQENYAVLAEHSGISYFTHDGKKTTLIGPKNTIYYTLKPGGRNGVYKKLEHFARLSPYTTWAVRLVPANGNDPSNFSNLVKYAENTNITLEGKGSYWLLSI